MKSVHRSNSSPRSLVAMFTPIVALACSGTSPEQTEGAATNDADDPMATASVEQAATAAPAMQRIYRYVEVAPGSTGNVTASCPTGTIVTSGGAVTAAGGIVYRSRKSGNGWNAAAYNGSASSFRLIVHANCLANTSGSISEVLEYSPVSPGATGVATAHCPSGTLLTGGGYIQGVVPSMSVFASIPSGTAWEVHAQNSASSEYRITATAMCLSGVDGYTLRANALMTIPPLGDRWDSVSCSAGGLAVGGGVYTYQTINWHTSYMAWGGTQWIGTGYNPSTTTGYDFRTYVQCLYAD